MTRTEGTAKTVGKRATGHKPIRVITADDSALIRLTLNRYLSHFPDIKVVGQAANGCQALDMIGHLHPDIIVLDVEMPEMDGIETLERIMQTHPLPVVMLSNLTRAGAEVTLRALEIGAVDFVLKPHPGVTMAETAEVLVEKIRQAMHYQLRSVRPMPARNGKDSPSMQHISVGGVSALRSTDKVVVVASSTGGPSALSAFFSNLPPGLPIGGVVVQHMPEGFTAILSQRLDRLSGYRIVEASRGARLQRGQFLVAPGGFHLLFDDKGKARLTEDPAVNGVRPAADVTMQRLAQIYGPRLIGVVMTGMGKDGFAGASAIAEAGGAVLAQDEQSSVVYGMPRQVVEARIAQFVAEPARLGAFIGESDKVL